MQQSPGSEEYINRKGGILTPGQRQFLLEGADESGNSARQKRYRIRQRLIEAVRDFYYLQHLPDDDIHQVFQAFRVGREGDDPDETLEPVAGLFDVLYTGLSLGHFEKTMRLGVEGSIIRREVRERGTYPQGRIRFDVDLEPEKFIDVERTAERLKEYERGEIPGWFTPKHYNALFHGGRLDEFSDETVVAMQRRADAEMQEQKRREKVERIKNATPGFISLLDSTIDDPELRELLDDRRRELADEMLEQTAERGLNRQDITVLESVGEIDEPAAERLSEWYRLILHLHECSGLLELEDRQEREAHRVTPEMYDPEMREVHEKHARELLERHKKGEQLEEKEYQCLLAEDLVDHEEIEEEYSVAVAEDMGPALPPEYPRRMRGDEAESGAEDGE